MKTIEQLLPLVKALAFKRAPKTNVPVDDLIQEGSLALIEAYEKYDPNCGATVETYVYSRIYYAIHDAAYPNRRTRQEPEVLLEEPIEVYNDPGFEKVDVDEMVDKIIIAGRLSDRATEALNLYRQGYNFVEIGERMGVSKQRAHGLFKESVKEFQKVV